MANTYNPSNFNATQKSLGVSKAVPTDARSYYHTGGPNFLMRPYRSVAEALAYLDTPNYRSGHYSLIINSGGVYNPATETISGGVNTEYWFRNGTADSHLVRKYPDITDADIAKWNSGTGSSSPTLNQVLTTGYESNLSPRIGSLFIKGETTSNLTEIDTYTTSPTRKVMLPDNSGTFVLSVNGVAPSNTSGDVTLNVYTKTEVYTKAEVDAIVGSGEGGVAGVSSFNSRTGAVAPIAGDYTKAMVGLGNVDDTADLAKPISTAVQTALNLKVDKNGTDRLITAAEATKLANTSNTNTGDETGPSIRSKLGITTLSGVNTGDQDLSGYVQKVTGKDLIATSEITRLASVQNVNLIQGSNVTITGSYPNLTISATGGSGSSSITVAAGVTQITIPAGTFVNSIVFIAPTATSVAVGFTSGATDLIATTSVTTKHVFQVLEYFTTSTTLYFTKAADTTAIIF